MHRVIAVKLHQVAALNRLETIPDEGEDSCDAHSDTTIISLAGNESVGDLQTLSKSCSDPSFNAENGSNLMSPAEEKLSGEATGKDLNNPGTSESVSDLTDIDSESLLNNNNDKHSAVALSNGHLNITLGGEIVSSHTPANIPVSTQDANMTSTK